MPKLSDASLIGRLIKHYGGLVPAQLSLGLPYHQTLDNWRRRGIPASARPGLWAHCNDIGIKLNRDWLIESAAHHAEGTTNGRARKKPKRKATRRRKAPRKAARPVQDRAQQPRA